MHAYSRAQATRGHPGQGDFSHLAYHTHAPVGMLQVIGEKVRSPEMIAFLLN